VWNYPFPGVLHASAENDVVGHLTGLAQRLSAEGLRFNDTGRAFVRQEYLGDVIAGHVCDGIAKVAKRRANGVALS